MTLEKNTQLMIILSVIIMIGTAIIGGIAISEKQNVVTGVNIVVSFDDKSVEVSETSTDQCCYGIAEIVGFATIVILFFIGLSLYLIHTTKWLFREKERTS